MKTEILDQLKTMYKQGVLFSAYMSPSGEITLIESKRMTQEEFNSAVLGNVQTRPEVIDATDS